MPENQISLAINAGKSIISINGIDGNELLIEYSGDIDVTKFVDKLAEAIDGGSTFIVTKPPDNVDEKAALVLETINSIVLKFNEVVVASTASLEEVGPT